MGWEGGWGGTSSQVDAPTSSVQLQKSRSTSVWLEHLVLVCVDKTVQRWKTLVQMSCLTWFCFSTRCFFFLPRSHLQDSLSLPFSVSYQRLRPAKPAPLQGFTGHVTSSKSSWVAVVSVPPATLARARCPRHTHARTHAHLPIYRRQLFFFDGNTVSCPKSLWLLIFHLEPLCCIINELSLCKRVFLSLINPLLLLLLLTLGWLGFLEYEDAADVTAEPLPR